MRPLYLALLAITLTLACAGCGALDAVTTLTLGAGDLPRIQVHEAARTAGLREAGCVPAALEPVRVAPVPGACRITGEPTEVVLVDEAAARNLAGEIGGMPTQAVKKLSLVVDELALTDGAGDRLPLAETGGGLTLALDGVDLFAGLSLERLEAGGARVVLPEEIRQRFAEALVQGEPLSATVSWSVDLPGELLEDAPDRLEARVVLQPEVEVDLVDAAPALFH